MKSVTIVVPVYNEGENILHFTTAVKEVMDKQPYKWTLLFVDDGSRDNSLELLEDLQARLPYVKVIALSRNCGHQIALTCGLDHARGDAVISMDGDMQHPPELLPELLARWEEGYQVVQTIRQDTQGVSWAKKKTSALYYRLINRLSNVNIRPGGSDFRLLDRQAVEALGKYREHDRFLRGMVTLLGYKVAEVPFVAPPRFAGQSKYSLSKMVKLGVDGIVGYSVVPLRVAFVGGIIFALFSFLLLLHALYVYICDEAVSGWTTIMVCMSLFGGTQLIMLGIMGEYLGRIYTEVKNRPLYLVKHNGGENETTDCQCR
ncbi:MAG: glycosyltransferase family 2 protein [Selenomonas sp.]|uniref:glycosyltransferase family 2 protein n=1 Tax=Selenomonas sp. TaxID=2053611 RepID=UPI0025E2F6E5|nr:glycosyltransferase family 2 protein [Selenomonas sp.]MCR5758702.1 glycosyltransferase family 2 protein [Selenomonas sp.]